MSRRRAGLSPLWLLVAATAVMFSPPWWLVMSVFALALVPALARAAGALGASRAAARSLRAGEATLLGRDARGRALMVADGQLSAHGLILGASGAGKSTTLLALLTDHIRRGSPVIAIDMKGSPAFAGALGAAAQAAGRPFRDWTPDGPAQWNPLAHGNATELKDKLIATERFTEPHYQRAAERYLQQVLTALHEARPDRPTDLAEVVANLDPRRLSLLLRKLPAGRREHVQDYLAGLSSDQLSAIRGLATRLAIISESHTGRFLMPAAGGLGDVLDVRRALAGEQVALFSLNSSTYGQLSAQLGSLAVQDLIAGVGERLAGAPAPPALIAIDEFSALGAQNVINLLARGREAGVRVLLATQELADLDRAAPGLRDQVLGNTAIKIAHRQDVPASAHAIAQMAGTYRRWEETEQIRGLFASAGAARGTRREVERFLVHPDRVKRLRTGEAVVIAKLPLAEVRLVQVTAAARAAGPVRRSRAQAGPPPTREGPELG